MNSKEFNDRTRRGRISASWPHDQSYYRFQRTHKSDAPFSEPESANTFAGFLVCVGIIVVLAAILGGFGWLL